MKPIFTSSKTVPLVVFLLAVSAALFSDLYVPSLPLIVKDLKTTNHYAQFTITFFVLGFAIGQYFYGLLSDKYGRRPILMIALCIAVAASILCAQAATINLLLWGRFFQGIGIAACLSMPRAILRDVYQGKQMAQVVSAVSACVEFVVTFAPALGGYITYWYNWRGNFYFLFIFLLLTVSIVVITLPETNKQLDKNALSLKKLHYNYSRLLSNKSFISNAICSGIAYAILMIYFLMTPFIIQNNLNYSAVQYGLISLFISAMLVAGAVVNSICLKMYALNSMIFAGVVCLLLAGVSLYISSLLVGDNLYSVVICSMIAIVGSALLFANCSASALHHFPDIAGVASSLYSGLQITIAFALTGLTSLFGSGSAIALGFIYAALGVVACLAHLKAR